MGAAEGKFEGTESLSLVEEDEDLLADDWCEVDVSDAFGSICEADGLEVDGHIFILRGVFADCFGDDAVS